MAKLGTLGRSVFKRTSNESMRLLVTTVIGVMIGLFIGISFPAASKTKLNFPSSIISYIEGKDSGITTESWMTHAWTSEFENNSNGTTKDDLEYDSNIKWHTRVKPSAYTARGFKNRIAVSDDTRVKPSAFVTGGFGNRIAVSGDTRVKPSAFVVGGFGNRIAVSGDTRVKPSAFVAGGFGNRIAVSGDTRVKPSAFVAGGFGNRIAVSGDTRVKPSAFVAGGFGNRIAVSGFVYFSENFGSIPAYPPFGGKCRELGLPTTLQERYESTSGFPYHATRACIELTHLVVCLAPGSLLPCYKSAYRWFSGPPQTPKMGFWVIPLLVVSTAPGFLLPCYKSAYRWFAGPPQTPKMGFWVIPLLVVSTAPGFLLPCYKSAYRWFAGPPQTPKMGFWVIPLLVVSTAPGFLLPCYKSAYRWFAGPPQTPKMGFWVIPLVVSTAPGFLLPCYKSAYRWFAGPPQTPKMGFWVIPLLVDLGKVTVIVSELPSTSNQNVGLPIRRKGKSLKKRSRTTQEEPEKRLVQPSQQASSVVVPDRNVVTSDRQEGSVVGRGEVEQLGGAGEATRATFTAGELCCCSRS
ncbi:hypothetical protein IEQ34_003236 [Dendrobium chrysotoxum]|uniref:Uncharacterized protein n=1 Tax=Dendrobium chrysotoxum TaxID=161865 RepID=A0AAV7HKQ0_DENCH|nr:hypothetical protein IEQ34_003236 [Dendrobium chrysotoxum]